MNAPKKQQGRQRTYSATLRRIRATAVPVKEEKAVRITYSEYMFVALVIQHAMRMRHIVIRGLPGF